MIALVAAATQDMGTTGAQALRQVLASFAQRNVHVAVSRTSLPLCDLIQRYHLYESIGEDKIYATSRRAMAACRSQRNQLREEI